MTTIDVFTQSMVSRSLGLALLASGVIQSIQEGRLSGRQVLFSFSIASTVLTKKIASMKVLVIVKTVVGLSDVFIVRSGWSDWNGRMADEADS